MTDEFEGWRTSTRSKTDNCVEVGHGEAVVVVRDTKLAGASPVLEFRGDAWEAFTSRVKADDAARGPWSY